MGCTFRRYPSSLGTPSPASSNPNLPPQDNHSPVIHPPSNTNKSTCLTTQLTLPSLAQSCRLICRRRCSSLRRKLSPASRPLNRPTTTNPVLHPPRSTTRSHRPRTTSTTQHPTTLPPSSRTTTAAYRAQTTTPEEQDPEVRFPNEDSPSHITRHPTPPHQQQGHRPRSTPTTSQHRILRRPQPRSSRSHRQPTLRSAARHARRHALPPTVQHPSSTSSSRHNNNNIIRLSRGWTSRVGMGLGRLAQTGTGAGHPRRRRGA